MKTALLHLIEFYQRFLTLFSYGSCRYYPTCSEYVRLQVKYNNIFLAILNSIKRVLSCNQLFEGGIDYPIVKVELELQSNIEKIDFWLVPVKGQKGKYYLIKNIT